MLKDTILRVLNLDLDLEKKAEIISTIIEEATEDAVRTTLEKTNSPLLVYISDTTPFLTMKGNIVWLQDPEKVKMWFSSNNLPSKVIFDLPDEEVKEYLIVLREFYKKQNKELIYELR